VRALLRQARVLVAGLLSRLSRLVFPEAEGAGDHWQRVALNRAVDDYIATLDPSALSAAEISGDGKADRGWKQFTSLDYPEFDLCAPLEDRGEFDVVICEQVLEHVIDPQAAAANLRGLCRPGGRVIVSTPFLIKVHELPAYGMFDYWRFTPRGLSTLLEGAGLEVESTGSWGNHECVVGNLDRWSGYRRWHPLHNEPDIPVQVWAFARNPD
jgi:SAM-dependent methyltransferase